MWHIQVTAATARGFTQGGTFDDRDEPQVIAQVAFRVDRSAYVHATMSRGPITPGMWRELARKLHAMGVTRIDYEHKGKSSSREVARAKPRDTSTP